MVMTIAAMGGECSAETAPMTTLWLAATSSLSNLSLVSVVLFIIIMCIGIQKIWNDWYILYNIQLLYEYYCTEPIPKIHIDIEQCVHPTTTAVDSKVQYCEDIYDPMKPNKIQCYNPSTNEFLGEVNVMTADEIHEVLVKASAAQKVWSLTTFAQRRRVLRTIQQYIVQNMDTICAVAAMDSGKSIVDAALGEVITTTEKIRTICAWGELWLRPDPRPVSPMLLHKIATVEYIPYGMIATIAPWNYPYVLCFVLFHFCLFTIGPFCFVVAGVCERTRMCVNLYIYIYICCTCPELFFVFTFVYIYFGQKTNNRLNIGAFELQL